MPRVPVSWVEGAPYTYRRWRQDRPWLAVDVPIHRNMNAALVV